MTRLRYKRKGIFVLQMEEKRRGWRDSRNSKINVAKNIPDEGGRALAGLTEFKNFETTS